jgi:hypothetical protein
VNGLRKEEKKTVAAVFLAFHVCVRVSARLCRSEQLVLSELPSWVVARHCEAPFFSDLILGEAF